MTIHQAPPPPGGGPSYSRTTKEIQDNFSKAKPDINYKRSISCIRPMIQKQFQVTNTTYKLFFQTENAIKHLDICKSKHL